MKIYKVGGAVRDRLLGIKVTDIDRVVVGASTEEMLAKGFKPVGSDFPVFLDPKNGDEYALARTERKSGRGYGGFVFHASPEVTLEEDLIRFRPRSPKIPYECCVLRALPHAMRTWVSRWRRRRWS